MLAHKKRFMYVHIGDLKGLNVECENVKTNAWGNRVMPSAGCQTLKLQ
uniref:Uncharacterized protein n=1 Tax=Anguilla anguilla TaxID=7936 RepID=A0A0E9X229_ANGAN